MPGMLIELINVGCSKSGKNLGSDAENNIAEVKLQNSDTGEELYLSLSDEDGMPSFYKTEESSFEFQFLEPDDKEKWDELNKHLVKEITDYADIPEDDELTGAYMLLASLIWSGEEECEKIIMDTINKYVDEIGPFIKFDGTEKT